VREGKEGKARRRKKKREPHSNNLLVRYLLCEEDGAKASPPEPFLQRVIFKTNILHFHHDQVTHHFPQRGMDRDGVAEMCLEGDTTKQ
jgi:hypothetical protein